MIDSAGLRIAVLIKQVPKFEAMQLGPEGRLLRDGLNAEMNPYCRRAVSKGVELATATQGHVTVLSLGPPGAEDVLREAIAWGASDGVLITDPAFAGSDTLATARALARALDREGPFDLVLMGRNSTDSDTGQVGPQVAELLGHPFLGGVRELRLEAMTVKARCELDDGWLQAETTLPVVLSCAERLCDPAKVDSAGRAAVSGDRIRRLSAADLGPGPWGQAGSPTTVGRVRLVERLRAGRILRGSVEEQVDEAIAHLWTTGVLAKLSDEGANDEARASPVPPTPTMDASASVAALLEPNRSSLTRELLGEAATLAAAVGATVLAIGTADVLADTDALSGWGADAALELRGSTVQEDVAIAVSGWAASELPWGLLVPGTMWGREVAARAAVRLGVGLTGDVVELDVEDGRLVGWKPAFGGSLAAITSTSEIQMATLRPGCVHLRSPRLPNPELRRSTLEIATGGRVREVARGRDDDIEVLARARAVVGVGSGVEPDDYPRLDPLLHAFGAELGATRKVTDRGWLPRARQIGITGRSIAPRMYVAIGVSGKFNHTVGVRRAGCVLAINTDPEALVFSAADIGIIGRWEEVVPALAAAVTAARGR